MCDMPQEGERGGGHRFRMLGICRRAFSRVRLSVLRDGNDDSEAGDRGNEGRKAKRKALGQTRKKKHLYAIITKCNNLQIAKQNKSVTSFRISI